MSQEGKWKLAPAYDITFSSSSHGHHSISIAGESKNPNVDDLKKLAKTFSIKNINAVIELVKISIAKWNLFADEALVLRESRERICGIIFSNK